MLCITLFLHLAALLVLFCKLVLWSRKRDPGSEAWLKSTRAVCTFLSSYTCNDFHRRMNFAHRYSRARRALHKSNFKIKFPMPRERDCRQLKKALNLMVNMKIPASHTSINLRAGEEKLSRVCLSRGAGLGSGSPSWLGPSPPGYGQAPKSGGNHLINIIIIKLLISKNGGTAAQGADL